MLHIMAEVEGRKMSDVRPQGISDEAWLGIGVIGAVYTRSFYPSFIDLPEDAAFLSSTAGRLLYVRVVRRGRALNVTDYRNELIERAEGELRVASLVTPLEGIDPDNISAVIADRYGSSGLGIVIEKTRDRVWRNVPFTEIVVGWEVSVAAEFGILSPSEDAVLALLQAYRFARHDLRARIEPAVTGAIPLIRSRIVAYQDVPTGNAFERLASLEPSDLRLDIISFGDAVDGVASSVLSAPEAEEVAERVGGYLLHPLRLPDLFLELEILAERTPSTRAYRASFAEAMTLAELTIGSAVHRLKDVPNVRSMYREGPDRTWKHMAEKLLPALLACYNGERATLLREIALLVVIRHRVVHDGYKPTAEETSRALSLVHHLMMILLLPSYFRTNYKLREGLPEPQLDD